MERKRINETMLGVIKLYQSGFSSRQNGLTEFYRVVTRKNHDARNSVRAFEQVDWGDSDHTKPGLIACAKIVIDELLLPEDEAPGKMTFNKGIKFMLEQDLDHKLIKAMVFIASARYNKGYDIGRAENEGHAKKLIDSSTASEELILAAMELYRNA